MRANLRIHRTSRHEGRQYEINLVPENPEEQELLKKIKNLTWAGRLDGPSAIGKGALRYTAMESDGSAFVLRFKEDS